MPQHAHPHFFARHQRDRIADQVAHRPSARDLLQFGRQLDAFRHHHDRKALALALTPRNELAYALNAERNLRNQDDVRAPRNPARQRDPAAIASHDFNHHHPVVRRRRGVNLVDRVRDGVQRRVESESQLRGRKIVIDGLGHAHNLQAFLKQFVPDLLRAVAADGDDGVNPQLAGVRDHLVGDVAHHLHAVLLGLVAEGIAAVGGAENRSAARQNAADAVERQLKRFFRPDQAIEAVRDSNDFPLVLKDGRLGGGANDRVEAGSIPASSSNADATYVRHEELVVDR